MNQTTTLLLFLVIVIAKISLAFDNNEIENKLMTDSSLQPRHYHHHKRPCAPNNSTCWKSIHHVTQTHCWNKTKTFQYTLTRHHKPTSTIIRTSTQIKETCSKTIVKVPPNKTHTISTKKHHHTSKHSNNKSKSRSLSISKSKSKSISKYKSKAHSLSKSKSKSKAVAESIAKSKSKKAMTSKSRTTTVTKFSTITTTKTSKATTITLKTTPTPTPTPTTTAVTTPTAVAGILPTHDSNSSSSGKSSHNTNDSNNNNNNNNTNDSNTNTTQDSNTSTDETATASTTPTDADVLASPTDNGVLNNKGGGNVPSDVFNNSDDPSAANNISNKALGVGLGVGIGCIAALGLAGLFIHNRKKQQQIALNNEDGNGGEVPTRWRPQSFMGVVASVVSKLPRSPSQRSKASTDMLTNNNHTSGIAIGHGDGAIESSPTPPRQY